MAPDDRPAPPPGARDLVVVVLDSCRYDSFVTAGPSFPGRLGEVERRWSYASWTSPSHFNLLMGLLPHASPTHVFASDYYRQDFLRYRERLGVPDVDFASVLPSIWLPRFLRRTLGYLTRAMVSLPVLNRHVPLNLEFDSWELMPSHNDMGAMVDRLAFDPDRPTFWLLNVGETHYPYALPDEDPSEWPRISGVHGVFKHLDDLVVGGRVATSPAEPFDRGQLDELRARQVRAVAYLDGVVGRLLDTVPDGTWVVVTADHGELFGEDGYFGHGPIAHDKVFEVPFVEGAVRR